MRTSSALSAILVCFPAAVHSFTSYGNEFISPSKLVSVDFPNLTVAAQETIVQWANDLAAQGPWSVTTSKPFNAPSNDSHDYLSWAPYWHANCTGLGNITELTPEEVWVTCPYVQIDGVFSDDVRVVNNTGAFSAMSDAVFYNVLAWAVDGDDTYASNAASYIKTWFLDPDTKMNPNLNYGQMIRGPNSTMGSHTGVLDLKCMAKVATGILALREGGSSAWTSDLNSQMITWSNEYMAWLETSPIALQEGAAANNHGTFYYNQLASMKLISDDKEGAQNVTRTYFEQQYLDQINVNGEQPLEAARTRPYHYRAYNIVAMITNARIAEYAGWDAWNVTSSSGATIQTALDYAMTIDPGDDAPAELYPSVASVGATYGDSDGTYAAFLSNKVQSYPEEPYFLFDQPLSDSGWVSANVANGTTTDSNNAGGQTSPTQTDGGLCLKNFKDPWTVGIVGIVGFGLMW
ncbi:chondroitin AC/alginate lyase [Amylostereum chailletii]|nr:chondroitin AC/alginate lyase [Amylostereum chailletii]